MRTHSGMHRDNLGSSVLIEYLFIIIILATFFTMFLLFVGSTMRNTDQVVVSQELGIVANDIANRISEFSNKVNIYQSHSGYWDSDVSGYTAAIDLPQLDQGKPYTVEIGYDETIGVGKITATYGQDVSVSRTVSFVSSTKVEETTIASTDANPSIYYDPALSTIRVVRV